MPTEHEVQRLEKVYRTYRGSQSVKAKWDAENPGNRAILQERNRGMEGLLAAQGLLPLLGRKVLEVGCGSGDTLAGLLRLGAHPDSLCGVDLLPERVDEAKQRHPELRFQCTNAEQLDFTDAHFDLVLLFTVISSILDEAMAHNVAREVNRVLAPGGAVLWYDLRYDNPANPNVRGMTSGRIRQLFPRLEIHLSRITAIPPLVRRMGRLAPLFYPVLAAIPPAQTHYLGLLIKPG